MIFLTAYISLTITYFSQAVTRVSSLQNLIITFCSNFPGLESFADVLSFRSFIIVYDFFLMYFFTARLCFFLDSFFFFSCYRVFFYMVYYPFFLLILKILKTHNLRGLRLPPPLQDLFGQDISHFIFVNLNSYLFLIFLGFYFVIFLKKFLHCK